MPIRVKSLKLKCFPRNNFLPLCSTSLLLRNGKQARRYRSLPLAMGENACLPALEESIIKKDLIFAFSFFPTSFLLLPFSSFMHSNKHVCTVPWNIWTSKFPFREFFEIDFYVRLWVVTFKSSPAECAIRLKPFLTCSCSKYILGFYLPIIFSNWHFDCLKIKNGSSNHLKEYSVSKIVMILYFSDRMI